MQFTLSGQPVPSLLSSNPQTYTHTTPKPYTLTLHFESTTLKKVSIKNQMCSNIQIYLYSSANPTKKHNLGQFFDQKQSKQFTYNILINKKNKFDRMDVILHPNEFHQVGLSYIEILPKSKKKQEQPANSNNNLYGTKPPEIDNSFFDKSFSHYHYIKKDPVGRKKKDEWEFQPEQNEQIASEEEEENNVIIKLQQEREQELDRRLDAKFQMFQLRVSDINQAYWDKHIQLERERGLLISQRLMRYLDQ